jgi:hypothetical protein
MSCRAPQNGIQDNTKSDMLPVCPSSTHCVQQSYHIGRPHQSLHERLLGPSEPVAADELGKSMYLFASIQYAAYFSKALGQQPYNEFETKCAWRKWHIAGQNSSMKGSQKTVAE